MSGIEGYGIYIPRFRIETKLIRKVWPLTGAAPGVAEKSVACVDEDCLTMGVEASLNALRHAGIEASSIGAVYFGTTSSPYADGSLAMLLAEVLGISSDVIISDFGGSTRAGTRAFLGCVDLVNTERVRYGLVIGSDCQKGKVGDTLEMAYGAGAAAFILGREGVIAEMGERSSYSTSFTVSWRPNGCTETNRYDDARLSREAAYGPHIGKAIKELLTGTSRKPDEFGQLALYQPDGRSAPGLAKAMKFNPEAMLHSHFASTIGDTGSSSALISLACALDNAEPGERILVASYGNGAGSDAFIVTAGSGIDQKHRAAVPAKAYLEPYNKQYIDYVQYEKIRGGLKTPPLPEAMSAFGASPSMLRDREYIVGLKALKCKSCGSINFPKRNICIEKDCLCREFEEVPLPRQGVVETFYHQYIVYTTPEEGPFPVCVARVSGKEGEYGGKITAMMIDSSMEDVKVGVRVELVFRRHGAEDGLVKYGYKFRVMKG